jgi:membrane fusion protein, multidrug efflux system
MSSIETKHAHGEGAGPHAQETPEPSGKSHKTPSTPVPPILRKRVKQVLFIAIFLFGAISGYKYYAFKKEEARRAAEMAAGPRIRVAKLARGVGDHRVVVVGETRPFQSATLYAKVSGYLKDVMVDKGDVVTKGQVLAVIESPEMDEAYIAAEADAKNKRSILVRMQTLYSKQLVSQQEFDQAQADSDVSTARLRSQQTLKGYETLKAPFPGTITARFADPGALVQNATSSETSALPVVMISEIARLRIDVFIDQKDAPFIVKEAPVTITMQEKPGFKLEGHVARISGELDPRTKMLLTEIDIDNDKGDLVAGSFVQVSMEVKSPALIEAPVESLVLKDDKTFLTMVTPDNTLTFKPVDIGSNDGVTLRLLSGAKEGDVVALNLGNSLPEGSKVRPIEGAK